ncbi:S9 family peptidase [Flavitalea flava]
MTLHTYTLGIIKCFLAGSFLLLSPASRSQGQPGKLTVEKIMQDPKWIGTSPSGQYWSRDGKILFFNWNPDNSLHDSLYYITREDLSPKKAPYSLQQNSQREENVVYNTGRTAYTYARDGDVYWGDARTGQEKRITQTVGDEHSPRFSFRDTRIVYNRNSNLFAWEIASSLTLQLTNFQKTPEPPKIEKNEGPDTQEKWLQRDQLELFDVLRTRKTKKDLGDSITKSRKPRELKPIYIDDKTLTEINISPDGRFIVYQLLKNASGAKNTIVPSYVTESGFTRDIASRTKVGAPDDSYSTCIFDRQKDTLIVIPTGQIPGISDLPDYVKDYPSANTAVKDTNSSGNPGMVVKKDRPVIMNGPYWSPKGNHAVLDIRSQDNKDRWLMNLDEATGKLKLVDRQRDEAWIGGPGIGYHFGGSNCGWIDENTFWYQSETSGYSHLYRADLGTGKKIQLTSGSYEILQASLSIGKKLFFITTNEVDPGEQQFYQLPVAGGKSERITTLPGGNQVVVSPDEKQLAFLYSYSNKPWELYLQDNKAGSQPKQITTKARSNAFLAYPWREPEFITFNAADGATAHARLYRPGTANANTNAGKPAVIFVHGAGYLQNAHKWWSYYFREFMFHNLLADNGYTVLDIDYRGSAGYGRDWRTGIYRHMGGKDLSDQVDGVKYLVEHEGVDPKHIGLYGGSYGGFITLMAMFTQPDVFAAGAALRSVTDWAHYNHGYTSDILNEPATDSLAYRRSSPIYFAQGLKGHLLMCHGMVDENVHFQDIVRLTQRLIELGKNDWELAVYPLEDHGFAEPSSWTDEYKRIFRLFETYLKK